MEAPKYPDRNGLTDLKPLPVYQKQKSGSGLINFNDIMQVKEKESIESDQIQT